MIELLKKLINISDVYDDFILGVVSYAKKDIQHIKLLNEYIDNNHDLRTSDIVEFIIQQPDFREYSAFNIKKEMN